MANTETMVKMITDRWEASLKNCNALLDAYSNEQLHKEIAPGKNTGIYLLGHLIAVHDDMLVLLDLDKKQYPALQAIFLNAPDKSVENPYPATELRKFWQQQCLLMREKLSTLKPENWFEKHSAVSAEDFSKEPHRNKLNILITRTSHLAYHTGQLVLLK